MDRQKGRITNEVTSNKYYNRFVETNTPLPQLFWKKY